MLSCAFGFPSTTWSIILVIEIHAVAVTNLRECSKRLSLWDIRLNAVRSLTMPSHSDPAGYAPMHVDTKIISRDVCDAGRWCHTWFDIFIQKVFKQTQLQTS